MQSLQQQQQQQFNQLGGFTVFVGHIPSSMNEEGVSQIFNKFGNILDITIIKDKRTNVSKGCAFITFSTKEEADNALNTTNESGTFLENMNKPLQVKYSDNEIEKMERKLFIGMLGTSDEDQIRILFGNYGIIEDLNIVREKDGKPKGYGFIKYSTRDESENALREIDGKHTLPGSNLPIIVKFADTERQKRKKLLGNQQPPQNPFNFYQQNQQQQQQQQQQQTQVQQLHNQLHQQHNQQIQQQAQATQQHLQTQQYLQSQIHQQSQQSQLSNNLNSNSKESTNIPKTNTQYTNFDSKNLDLASRYFSECSTKDFIGNKKKSTSVAWNANGTKIASSGSDGIVRVWNFDPLGNSNNNNNSNNTSSNSKNNNIKETIELKGHDGSIEKISWSPKNNDLLASAGTDKVIKIWDVKIGKCIGTVSTNSENIDVRWSPDGQFIVACTRDDHLALIDLPTIKTLKIYKFNGEELNQVGWDNNGDLILMANSMGNIEAYKFLPKSTTHVKHLKTLYGHTASIYCMEFDPTGKYLAAGSADSIVSLWDIEDMMCVKTFIKSTFPCRSVSFSFDGQFIAASSFESTIEIFHIESSQPIHTIECSGVSSLMWHPTLPLLAYAPEINENNKDPSIRVFGYHS